MEINIKEYWDMLRKRLWIVIVFVLLSTVLTAMYTKSNYQPIYQAYTKLIVNKTVEQGMLGQEQIDYGAISVNMALMNTYKEIIRTPAIMDKVVQRYPDLNLSSEQLVNSVSVSYINGTQVLTIGAKSLSYEKAVKVVNAVTDVFQTEIPKIMKIDNVTVLNRAAMQTNPVPVNIQSNQYIIISLVASLVIAIGVIILLEALDDTLKTEEEIRAIFDSPTLAQVPVTKDKEFRADHRNKIKAGETSYAKTIH